MPAGERDAVPAQRLDDPGGGAGDEAGLVEPEPADVHRVEAVDVLLRVDPVEDVARRQARGQRQLDEDAVDPRVGVELVEERQEVGRGGRRRQDVAEAGEAGLGAGAGLRADVDPRCRVVADQNDGETGRPAGAGLDFEGSGGDFGADLGGDGFGFEELGHLIFFLPR